MLSKLLEITMDEKGVHQSIFTLVIAEALTRIK